MSLKKGGGRKWGGRVYSGEERQKGERESKIKTKNEEENRIKWVVQNDNYYLRFYP